MRLNEHALEFFRTFLLVPLSLGTYVTICLILNCHNAIAFFFSFASAAEMREGGCTSGDAFGVVVLGIAPTPTRSPWEYVHLWGEGDTCRGHRWTGIYFPPAFFWYPSEFTRVPSVSITRDLGPSLLPGWSFGHMLPFPPPSKCPNRINIIRTSTLELLSAVRHFSHV